ncbi:hypothetical protein HanXRQr2_Chr04g0177141 [Helianthus annuus]|uniref:Uncharacterized protein n=3 Tax=Helianthus annuus TaxID=4232 RepID=A0A9K3J9Y3_HELAN|nr:hypothetical protein HanXRQr2_Chr04g0177141 [Helianthus annuus]KAJ0589853.1 hypothetical protein HanIR_Chr04g0190911 [Helianthus annuus]KAJ0758397.1 hypothetical protein HanLR1_Chr04g0149961 [Helianthus annuus]KAJ0932197.1 hypothetical protein HanPSC8_Chr04g0170901 [Helianthus annuus]
MSGLRRFAVSRSEMGDRSGSYAASNPHVNQVVMQPQLRGQQILHHQVEKMTVADVEKQTVSAGFDAALSIPPVLASSASSSSSGPPNNMSNLDSFLESVTPVVPARRPSEVDSTGRVSGEGDMNPYYCIGDLWESFQEWSAYGVGVPFLLSGIPTTQYYVPFLSGMQLYVDPEKVGCPAKEPDQGTSSVLERSFDALNLNHQKLKQVMSWDTKTEACGSRGKLAFEFMEREQPYTRKTLSDKASVLVSQFPELSQFRSCDLSPSSWISVAWYPIYRIPVGPTLKDLEASFLTLHPLSTQPGSYSGSEFSSKNADGVNGTLALSSKIRLPVIGLASYKLKGSIISPCDPQERKKENDLFEAANKWLTNLRAHLPDYQFFLRRH